MICESQLLVARPQQRYGSNGFLAREVAGDETRQEQAWQTEIQMNYGPVVNTLTYFHSLTQAKCDGKYVGAIVCKLEMHHFRARRGYIAMLAVDRDYRKRRIGQSRLDPQLNRRNTAYIEIFAVD